LILTREYKNPLFDFWLRGVQRSEGKKQKVECLLSIPTRRRRAVGGGVGRNRKADTGMNSRRRRQREQPTGLRLAATIYVNDKRSTRAHQRKRLQGAIGGLASLVCSSSTDELGKLSF